MTKSASLYASFMSDVATKSRFSLAKYFSISLSVIGDFLLFIKSIFFSTISTARTQLFCASKTAIERPTYPVPATAIFILFNSFTF